MAPPQSRPLHCWGRGEPVRCAHLSCRFQALPRTSMWDMEGEDFSEPGEGWSVVTVGSLGTLGGVSQGVSLDESLCGWIAGGHLVSLGRLDPLGRSL